MTYYQRFLTSVLKSKILRSAEFLETFLKEANEEQFDVKAQTFENEQGPQRIADIATLAGEIDVKARGCAKDFCQQFDKYINTHTEINNL